jgi:hypothetical protein
MAAGVKHYFANGREHKGPMHKTDGKAMSGAKHTASSKLLTHKKPMKRGKK